MRPLGPSRLTARRGRCERLARRRLVLHRRHRAQGLRHRGPARWALLFVLGDDATDRSEDLLHRGLLFSRRLRHGRRPPHSGRGTSPARLQQNQRLAPEQGNYDTPGMEGKEAAVSRMRYSANGVSGTPLIRDRHGLGRSRVWSASRSLSSGRGARTRGCCAAPGTRRSLPSVGDTHAAPGVAHLLVVNGGIVDLDPEPKNLRR